MFFVFRDSYVIYIWVMNILCTFHIFMYGYVTFNGISTFVSYLMTNPVLKTNWSDTIWRIAVVIKGIHTFLKSICLKVNVIWRLNSNVAIQHISIYTTGTPLTIHVRIFWVLAFESGCNRFEFFKASCNTKVKETKLSDYLLISGGRIIECIPFLRVLFVQWDM